MYEVNNTKYTRIFKMIIGKHIIIWLEPITGLWNTKNTTFQRRNSALRARERQSSTGLILTCQKSDFYITYNYIIDTHIHYTHTHTHTHTHIHTQTHTHTHIYIYIYIYIYIHSNKIINWKQTHNLCLGKFTLLDLKRKLNRNRDSKLGPPDL